MRLGAALLILSVACPRAFAQDSLILTPGFVSKLSCEGKLYLSSIGNPAVVELQALPKELGCGVILKSLAWEGTTNLILETSTGTIERLLVIRPSQSLSKERKK